MSLFKNQNIKSMESFNILSDPLKILHPSSYGNNCLDRKILWIFTQFLFNELQQGNLFESFIDSKIDFGQFYLKLTRNFVTQLEILGLWDQAVILLIHVPQTFLRNQTKDKWIKNIIHRNYLEDVN